MKITFENTELNGDEDKFTYESKRDGYTLDELTPILKGLLVFMGYHPNSVNDCFSEDVYDWFPAKDIFVSAKEPEITLPEGYDPIDFND